MPTYDPSTWEEEAGGGESGVSLGYITNSKVVCSTGGKNSSKEPTRKDRLDAPPHTQTRTHTHIYIGFGRLEFSRVALDMLEYCRPSWP